jgi:hypothetical protein
VSRIHVKTDWSTGRADMSVKPDPKGRVSEDRVHIVLRCVRRLG